MVLGTILDFLVYPDHQLPFFFNRVITFGLLLFGLIPLALSASPKMVRLIGHWVVSLPMVAIGR